MTQQIVEFVNHKKLLAPQLNVAELGGMPRTPKSNARAAFAQHLQLARRRKYQSAAAMARALRIEQETYRRYERGETEPSIAELGRIVRELGVSADFLLLGDLPAPDGRK
jgi:ribosome-binding protein aMBF1 (putative translation factor)